MMRFPSKANGVGSHSQRLPDCGFSRFGKPTANQETIDRGSSFVLIQWRSKCSEASVLKIGIVGLSQVGKTTLFSILTHAQIEALISGKPEAHVGVATVPDARLDHMAQMYKPRKLVHATVEYVDTPGGVIDLARAGAQSATLREAAALVHVVRAFGEGDSEDAARIQG